MVIHRVICGSSGIIGRVRIWSVAPSLLDRAALIAGWREGLLAQKVLRGLTRGYRNHPQLERFRDLGDPVLGIATWLHGLADEATARGYTFDRTRVVVPPDPTLSMPLTEGQLGLEWAHLRVKVEARDPLWWSQIEPLQGIEVTAHPLFRVVPGPVACWERAPHPLQPSDSNSP